MIGVKRDDMGLLVPDAAYRRVAMFLRETGEHWAPSLRELHKELVARGYLWRPPTVATLASGG